MQLFLSQRVPQVAEKQSHLRQCLARHGKQKKIDQGKGEYRGMEGEITDNEIRLDDGVAMQVLEEALRTEYNDSQMKALTGGLEGQEVVLIQVEPLSKKGGIY